MKNLMESMAFSHDVWYIARTNEEGPPIKCQFLRWEEHVNSGEFWPIFAELKSEGWREFLFFGPTVLFDQVLFDRLSQMGGLDGWKWLVSQF